jgi:hypothetical protein
VGLEVFLDGASVGRTPLSVKATVGAHNVSIRDPNGISQSRKVEVKKNIIVPVTWSFGTGSESDDKQRR